MVVRPDRIARCALGCRAPAGYSRRRCTLGRGARVSSIPSMKDEFEGAELGDARRTKRLQVIAEALGAAPDRSLPEIAGDEAELEAMYRFINHEAMRVDELVSPHARAASSRAEGVSAVLALHDATHFVYP